MTLGNNEFYRISTPVVEVSEVIPKLDRRGDWMITVGNTDEVYKIRIPYYAWQKLKKRIRVGTRVSVRFALEDKP